MVPGYWVQRVDLVLYSDDLLKNVLTVNPKLKWNGDITFWFNLKWTQCEIRVRKSLSYSTFEKHFFHFFHPLQRRKSDQGALGLPLPLLLLPIVKSKKIKIASLIKYLFQSCVHKISSCHWNCWFYLSLTIIFPDFIT